MSRSAPARRLARLLLVLALVSSPVGADEGMWPVHDFPAAAVEEAHGVTIDGAWLDRVRRSTVRLEGGCSGSFVSPEGLVLTNRHCLWACLGRLSTDERNLSETGFAAADRSGELRCPGLQISVLEGTEEVTDRVRGATEGLDEVAAREARTDLLASLRAECESDGDVCAAVDLHQGAETHLYRTRRHDDVRLVFTPERAVGAFGGDLDNFEFPRWWLDVALLRVYEDGAPVATPDHFRWDPDGPDEGEPVFVVGHPGETLRQRSVAELEILRRWETSRRLLVLSELRGRLVRWAASGEEAAVEAARRLPAIDNALELERHRFDGLLDGDAMARARERDGELRRAVAADPELAAAYGSAWDDARRARLARAELGDRYTFLAGGEGLQGRLYAWARALVRAGEERARPDAERPPGFREAALPSLERRLLAPAPVDATWERFLLGFSLEKMRQWLGTGDPIVSALLGSASPEELAERLVGETGLADPAVRRALWEGGAGAIEGSDDPMIVLARTVDPAARELHRRYLDEVVAPFDRSAQKMTRARLALGRAGPPDGTFTLRVSYGTVRPPADGAEAFTRLGGLWERATGREPYRLPESWLEARDRLDPQTPFVFTTDADTTVGSSGSPVVDAAGRLVGLGFDVDAAALAGTYHFAEAGRTLALHPAIVLEALETVYGTDRLLDELSLATDHLAPTEPAPTEKQTP